MAPNGLSREQLLAELENVLRCAPAPQNIADPSDENFFWLGRATAAMHLWDPVRGAYFNAKIDDVQCGRDTRSEYGYRQALVMLQQAAHELRLQTSGPLAIHIEKGRPFDYFDELRKIIESATSEIFVVDRYLNADFASRYLPFVRRSVPVRILASKHVAQLAPALAQMSAQEGLAIELRKSSHDTHDRHIFIDRTKCYLSCGSFCDGGVMASVTLTQIVDAMDAVLTTCEQSWKSAACVQY